MLVGYQMMKVGRSTFQYTAFRASRKAGQEPSAEAEKLVSLFWCRRE
jgi:hypothetical protein